MADLSFSSVVIFLFVATTKILSGFPISFPRYYQRLLKCSVPRCSISSSLDVNHGGAWLPICSITGMGDEPIPARVELAGENYVVWQSNSTWSVMSDVCPHRAAPLSQGRVDKSTGCLECPYHGWQFDGSGHCTKIPQASGGSASSSATKAGTLPTYITGDLLWAFVPLPVGQASHYPDYPDEVFPILRNVTSFTMRELPYSFDFLMENFMDPAHIPFAHHSLQGVRGDGSPIPMKLLTSLDNSSHCEISFKDVIRGKPREGVLSFVAPCYFHFRVKNAITNLFRMALLVIVAPVAPGKCRAFLSLSPGTKMPALFSLLPRWLLHAVTNKFLDSDIWVHDQERTVRSSKNKFLSVQKFKKPSVFSDSGLESGLLPSPVSGDIPSDFKYTLMTTSDTGCRVWREWWSLHMKQSRIFGPAAMIDWLPWEQQLDYYDAHIKHCVSCRTALTNTRIIQRWAPLLALLPMALCKRLWMRLAGVVVYIITNLIADKVVRAIAGPERGELTSAAQFSV